MAYPTAITATSTINTVPTMAPVCLDESELPEFAFVFAGALVGLGVGDRVGVNVGEFDAELPTGEEVIEVPAGELVIDGPEGAVAGARVIVFVGGGLVGHPCGILPLTVFAVQ